MHHAKTQLPTAIIDTCFLIKILSFIYSLFIFNYTKVVCIKKNRNSECMRLVHKTNIYCAGSHLQSGLTNRKLLW